VASLGTSKKSKSKRGKAAAQNNESTSQDSLDSHLHLLTEQLSALEKENNTLKANCSDLEGHIKSLEVELLQNDAEKNVLQQRVDSMTIEPNSETSGINHSLDFTDLFVAILSSLITRYNTINKTKFCSCYFYT